MAETEKKYRAAITATERFLPAKVVTNADMEKLVDTSDEWIRSRTGIVERRFLAEDEPTSKMAIAVAEGLLKRRGLTGGDIDLIIVATITPDMPFPATACLVQEKLGAHNAAAFDIEAACSGFVYALEIGQQFIMSRTYDTVLVIGAEKLSSIVDWEDRNTCILFGDGAGAAVLQNRENTHGLLTACMGADGRKASILSQPGGGCLHPATSQSVSDRLHFLKMDGKEVFKSAVTAMTTAAREALARCELEIDRIKCIIPHQANMRILKAVGDRLGASEDQVFSNLERYGNTSAASVAIALDEAVEQGKVERGDLILLLVFGAGLTWGAAIIEW